MLKNMYNMQPLVRKGLQNSKYMNKIVGTRFIASQCYLLKDTGARQVADLAVTGYIGA